MTTTVIYTNANLEEEIRTIKGLETKIKELDELKKEKENLIKSVMEKAGVETMNIAGFVVRYTKFLSNRFDTSLFKKLHLSTYQQFVKQVQSTKFTIA